MKKISFILMTSAIAVLLAVDVNYFCSNSAALSQLNASSSSASPVTSTSTQSTSTKSTSTKKTSTKKTNTNTSTSGSGSSGSSSSKKNDNDKTPTTYLGCDYKITAMDSGAGLSFKKGDIISYCPSAEITAKYHIKYTALHKYCVKCPGGGSCGCEPMGWTNYDAKTQHITQGAQPGC
ncbi:MAG: hypothetical protein J6P55_01830 [Bacteroidaceae bacterium]|nr:hypothetical protein [Bacteroidaceae bacterium]